tara:strand:- start:14061 stop:14348 length:288 start_codon:yes stop_codon:yes gene_type:complete
MAKSATKKTTTKKVVTPTASKPLAAIAQTKPNVRSGGLQLTAVLKANFEKTPRSDSNLERQKTLDGKTVEEALASRLVDARDIKYDLDKGFMTLA